MKKFTMLFVCLVMLGVHIVNAQQKTITGTVTSSEDGMSLPGVSVAVKGTTVGTITNINGQYSLDVPADAQALVFSFVGMTTVEQAIGGRAVIDVVLEPEVFGVDEVVITAFGISREKKAVTYQTETVSGDNLRSAQSTDISTGLVGKVAGLQVNIQDNGVKPNSQILLRGLRSISGNNEALVVIDGSIASAAALNDMNPNDIESLNTLKGATAAALYGSNASNGALIVTTKKGKKAERFTAGIMHSTTFEKVAYMPDFQTEHGTGWDGEYNNIENTNWGPRFDGQVRQIGPTFADGSFQAVPYAPVKDNVKNFYNTGSTMQNTAYFTGGDETGSFYMSIGNQDTKGIVPDDTFKKNTFRVNANKLIGKLELSSTVAFSTDELDVVGSTIGDQDRPLYWFLLNTPANIPLTSYKDWDNPESYGYADNYYNAFYQNPYWAIGTNRNNEKTNRLVANISASWDILDNLNFVARASVNSVSLRGKNWRARQTYDEVLQPYHSTVSSFVEDKESESTTYNTDALLQGDFKLTEDISLKAIAGTNVNSFQYNYSRIRANNLSIEGFYDISNGTGQLEGVVDSEQERSVGFFGDLTFDFRKWAYLNVTGRQDYTSTLAKGNNGYFYPSVSASFILSDAISALNDMPFLEMFKVFASNSTVYNDLAPYRINERYFQSRAGFPFPFGDINGFETAATAVDADIQKEKLNSTEIGTNIALFKGRLNIEATYFNTVTTNLITTTTPSYAAGASSYLTNIGKMTNNGIELSIGGTIVKSGDLKWDVDFNYYTAATVVDEIKEGIKETSLDAYTAGYGTYAIVGEVFPQIKAVSYVRDPQGRIVVDAGTGNPVIGPLKIMGQTTPKHTLQFNTQLHYKGFTFSTTMDYRTGHVYYAQGSDQMEFTGRSMESVMGDRKDFVWPNSVIETSPGVYVENTDIPITGGKMDFWQNQYNVIKENYVKDASAFKIRELSLNYSLPKSLLDNAGFISKVTLGVVARNVLTIFPKEKYIFSDPEFRNTRSTDDPNGIGIGGYFASPPTRSFGFSVNVEF
jgi:TonB-linked SusC/RagA family outer membrane protein